MEAATCLAGGNLRSEGHIQSVFVGEVADNPFGQYELVSGIHLRFIPENSKGEKLTSRELKKECVLQAAYVISSQKKTIDGKEVTYQEKIPISSYAAATHQADGNGGNGGGGGDDEHLPGQGGNG